MKGTIEANNQEVHESGLIRVEYVTMPELVALAEDNMVIHIMMHSKDGQSAGVEIYLRDNPNICYVIKEFKKLDVSYNHERDRVGLVIVDIVDKAYYFDFNVLQFVKNYADLLTFANQTEVTH